MNVNTPPLRAVDSGDTPQRKDGAGVWTTPAPEMLKSADPSSHDQHISSSRDETAGLSEAYDLLRAIARRVRASVPEGQDAA